MKNKIIVLSVLVLTFTFCLLLTNKLKDTSASEVEQVSNDYSNITPYEGTAIDWNGFIDTIYFNKYYDSVELYNLLSSLPYFSLPQVPDKSIYPIWSNSDMSSTLVINWVYELWEDGTFWSTYNFMVLDSSFDPLYYFGYLKYIGSSTPYVICHFSSDDLSSYTINSQNYVGTLLNYLGVNIDNRNEDLSCLFSSTPFQLKGASGGASEEELEEAYNNGYIDGRDDGFAEQKENYINAFEACEQGLITSGYYYDLWKTYRDLHYNKGYDDGFAESGQAVADAYEHGYDVGYDEGYENGAQNGEQIGRDKEKEYFAEQLAKAESGQVESGYYYDIWEYYYNLHFDSGYDDGLSDGEEIGYESGYVKGEKDGYDYGYTIGEDDGFERAYPLAYQEGYYAGADSVDNEFLGNAFLRLADVPFEILSSFLNFDIFGFNYFSLLCSFLTLGIVLLLLRKFL